MAEKEKISFELEKYIETKIPELRLEPKPTLDEIICAFLEKFEVYVKPITTKTRNIAGSAAAGAITGMYGADVGGDAFLIQGQAKQTQLQEWTSWKQWALSHNDFPEFKNKFNGEAEAKNKEIDEKLVEPAFVEKWEAHFKKVYEEESIRKVKANKQRAYALLALGVILVTIIGVSNSPEAKRFLQNEPINRNKYLP